MAHMLMIADDTEAYQDAYLEEFIKGFEILKLRIGKLKSYSTELDQMVSVCTHHTFNLVLTWLVEVGPDCFNA